MMQASAALGAMMAFTPRDKGCKIMLLQLEFQKQIHSLLGYKMTTDAGQLYFRTIFVLADMKRDTSAVTQS